MVFLFHTFSFLQDELIKNLFISTISNITYILGDINSIKRIDKETNFMLV